MRVVCPFTPGKRSLLTVGALARFAPDALYVNVAANPSAYWELLAELWRDGENFVIVEHDVEIHEGVIAGFKACREPWCLYPYFGPTLFDVMTRSLGCTRFSSRLIETRPDLMDQVGGHTDNLAQKDWRRLDTLVCHYLGLAGHEPHVHEPPVLHHHVYDGRCACGTEH